MKNISEIERFKTIDWLRKQRDGLIIGDYRNMLYDMYQKILMLSMSSEQCFLSDIYKTNADKYTIQHTLDLCNMLKSLGYIEFLDTTDPIVDILKPIDF